MIEDTTGVVMARLAGSNGLIRIAIGATNPRIVVAEKTMNTTAVADGAAAVGLSEATGCEAQAITIMTEINTKISAS